MARASLVLVRHCELLVLVHVETEHVRARVVADHIEVELLTPDLRKIELDFEKAGSADPKVGRVGEQAARIAVLVPRS